LADPYNIELNNDLQDSERADIAVSGNNVHVVWDSDLSEILYRRSLNGGATFGDITVLSDNLVDSNSHNPAIFADGNDVYIAWSDNSGVLLRKSTDGGETYGPTILVSATPQSSSIDLVVVGSIVYIVWSENITGDEGGNEIFFSKSVDGGDTFSPKRNLSRNGGDSIDPAITVYRNKLHIVWADESSGNGEILYRRSLNGGETFGIKNLSNTPSSSYNPTIAVFRDRLYIAWSDNSAGPFEIVLIKSKNGGTTFDTIDTLSNNPGDSRLPKLAVSENNIYVVWDAPGGIFFIRSPDSGTIFGAATIIIPDANRPAIAVSQNIAEHVCWDV